MNVNKPLQDEYYERCARFGIEPVRPCHSIIDSYEKFIEVLNQALKIAEETQMALKQIHDIYDAPHARHECLNCGAKEGELHLDRCPKAKSNDALYAKPKNYGGYGYADRDNDGVATVAIPTPSAQGNKAELLERLNVLHHKLEMEGAYVRANTVHLAIRYV
jgi:hypothetical protein